MKIFQNPRIHVSLSLMNAEENQSHHRRLPGTFSWSRGGAVQHGGQAAWPHRRASPTREENDRMDVTLNLTALVALIAGVLILVMPRLLNYLVAIYLIIVGILGLLGRF